jgi:hypothetical protein
MKLVIATPFYEMKGWSPYIKSIASTMWFLARHTKIEVTFWSLPEDSYVERARNTIANEFMKSEHTHLLFIDSDMEWDLPGLTRLLAADVDVVGAGYPCKNLWDFFGCILNVNEDETPKVNAQGLISAWGVPTGFMKIRKEVFFKMAIAKPDNFYMVKNPVEGEDPIKVFNFFGRMPPLGEDISFCRRWVDAGGELWVEPRVTITHYGTKGWSGNYDSFLKACPGGSDDPNRIKEIPAE